MEPTTITTNNPEDYVAFSVGGQLFGIHVLDVLDVLLAQGITRIPASPPAIAGSLNLRGRIVTAIDVRILLGMPACEAPEKCVNLVVEHQGYLYSLLVDRISEILTLSRDTFKTHSSNLSPHWKAYSNGVYTLDKELLVVLDVARLLESGQEAKGKAAA